MATAIKTPEKGAWFFGVFFCKSSKDTSPSWPMKSPQRGEVLDQSAWPPQKAPVQVLGCSSCVHVPACRHSGLIKHAKDMQIMQAVTLFTTQNCPQVPRTLLV